MIALLLNQIADQSSSILSINASIEAARAGQVGLGFAVVAKEIRQLEERTASAARDVRVIIGEINTALSQGTRSAANTRRVLVTSPPTTNGSPSH